MACAVHHQRVPASGFAHGVGVHLTPPDADTGPWTWPAHRGRLACHVVLARDDLLTVWEARHAAGDLRLVQLRAHRLFGQVTGMVVVRTVASQVDGRERLLMSFTDAKLALLEWDDVAGDLQTVSIHTFERAPQLASGLPPAFVPVLRADPASRCAALLLPQDALAVLPLYQEAAELGLDDARDPALATHQPYAPSFVLALGTDVDASIRNVRDICFLPGFQNPTLAVLYEPELTWTGSLSEAKQTLCVCLITLELSLAKYTVTVTSEPLPYDTLCVEACPEALGGVLLVTPSALAHLDLTGRLVGTSVSAWAAPTSTWSLPRAAAPDGSLFELDLQGSRLVFVEATQALLFLHSGAVYSLQCTVEGRTLTALSLAPVDATRDAGAACVARLPRGAILCASTLQDTCVYAPLASAAPVNVPAAVPSMTVMDDEDVDLYGESLAAPATPAAAPRASAGLALRVLDTLPTLAPVHSLAIGTLRDVHGGLSHRTVVAGERQLLTLESRLRCTAREPIAPAQYVWGARTSGTAMLLFAAWGEECLVYELQRDAPPRFVQQCTERTLACGATVSGIVRVTPHEASWLQSDGTAADVPPVRPSVPIRHACVDGAYVVLVLETGSVQVWRAAGEAWACLAEVPGTHADLCVGVGLGADVQLAVLSAEGHLALYTLPTMECTWSCTSLGAMPRYVDEAPIDEVDELDVQHIKLCVLGDIPALFVQYTNGQLAVYEARMHDTRLRFVLAEACMLATASDAIVPLQLHGVPCAAVTGAHSLVAVKTPKAALQCLETDLPLLSLCAHPDEDVCVCVHDGDACELAWEACELDSLVPYTRWRTGRSYTHVVAHDETGCLVAASEQPAAFVLYDDEERPVRDPAQDPTPTYTVRGALELFARVGEPPVHGYEFEAGERVTALCVAHLDALDRGSGRRAYIAAGTTMAFGEDRTARGHMYVWEVAESVPAAGAAPGDAMRLRLLCHEEMRAPVTALCDMSGFLVAAVGGRLLVRSLEFSEWLVTVAFLDTGVYTTSLQRVKNFVLLTDYERSAYWIAVQSDPIKLVLLGRDYDQACALQGGLLIDHAKLALVTCDPRGVLRLLDYQPSNPTSLGGQRLLLRCEYRASGEVVQALVVGGARTANDECFTSEVLLLKRNGALDVLVPVTDKVFPTLQLFQSQLVRAVPHTAALNPRAFRAVFHARTARPLAKGVLDGALLHTAERMPRPKLEGLVRELRPRTGGVAADDLLRCLVHLQPHW